MLNRKRGVSKVRWMTGFVIMLPVVVLWILFLSGRWQSYVVISASMDPTLQIHDCVIMKELGNEFDLLDKIVVFDDPLGEYEPLVKRVVANPNSLVKFSRGQLSVDNSPLPGETLYRSVGGYRAWSLSDDEYFVLGDNRNDSMDSIELGPVKRENLRGIIAFRYWPLSRIGKVQ